MYCAKCGNQLQDTSADGPLLCPKGLEYSIHLSRLLRSVPGRHYPDARGGPPDTPGDWSVVLPRLWICPEQRHDPRLSSVWCRTARLAGLADDRAASSSERDGRVLLDPAQVQMLRAREVDQRASIGADNHAEASSASRSSMA